MQDITITPGRQYVCEAQVTLLDEAVNRQRGWLYLFNDALLTTTEIEIAIRKTFPLQVPTDSPLSASVCVCSSAHAPHSQNKDAQDFCSFIPLEDIMTIDEAREYSTIVKVTCKGVRLFSFSLLRSSPSLSLIFVLFVVVHPGADHYDQVRLDGEQVAVARPLRGDRRRPPAEDGALQPARPRRRPPAAPLRARAPRPRQRGERIRVVAAFWSMKMR